jgi:hypothetical protein
MCIYPCSAAYVGILCIRTNSAVLIVIVGLLKAHTGFAPIQSARSCTTTLPLPPGPGSPLGPPSKNPPLAGLSPYSPFCRCAPSLFSALLILLPGSWSPSLLCRTATPVCICCVPLSSPPCYRTTRSKFLTLMLARFTHIWFKRLVTVLSLISFIAVLIASG